MNDLIRLLRIQAFAVAGIFLGMPFVTKDDQVSALIIPLSFLLIGFGVDKIFKRRYWNKIAIQAYNNRKGNNTIKPCSKCESNYSLPIVKSNFYFQGADAVPTHKIICTLCGCSSSEFDSQEEACNDWNERWAKCKLQSLARNIKT